MAAANAFGRLSASLRRTWHLWSLVLGLSLSSIGLCQIESQTEISATKQSAQPLPQAAAAQLSSKSASRPLPTLRTVQQVRSLSYEEAKRAYPVRVQAVVTFVDRDWGLLFVQDETA